MTSFLIFRHTSRKHKTHRLFRLRREQFSSKCGNSTSSTINNLCSFKEILRCWSTRFSSTYTTRRLWSYYLLNLVLRSIYPFRIDIVLVEWKNAILFRQIRTMTFKFTLAIYYPPINRPISTLKWETSSFNVIDGKDSNYPNMFQMAIDPGISLFFCKTKMLINSMMSWLVHDSVTHLRSFYSRSHQYYKV